LPRFAFWVRLRLSDPPGGAVAVDALPQLGDVLVAPLGAAVVLDLVSAMVRSGRLVADHPGIPTIHPLTPERQ
jgi:hypothetical protein